MAKKKETETKTENVEKITEKSEISSSVPETKKVPKKVKVVKPKVLTVTGKRKTAIAKATIRAGNGSVRINHKPIETLNHLRKLMILEPFRIAEEIMKDDLKKVDIDVRVISGGTESQIEAARLAIARALVAYSQNPELRTAFLNYDRALIVADVRRKEMRKPGDSKARARRQTSYR